MLSSSKVLRVTPEEKKKIYETINKTEDELLKDVEYIKEWLRKQPHLPQDANENMLKLTLLLNKYNFEKTKKKLDMYYSARNVMPNFYLERNLLSPPMKQFIDMLIFTPLPHLYDNHVRVYVCSFNKCEPENFSVLYLNQLVTSMLDSRLLYEFCLKEILIIDFKHLKMGHLTKFNPLELKNIIFIYKEVYADRVQGIHFVNMPQYASTFVTTLKTLLPTKIGDRLFVHKQMESLYEHCSKDILPIEYGGTFSKIDDIYDNYKNFLISHNDWLIKEGKKCSDETKRIGEPLQSDIFGMSGSFRQINID